MDPALTELRGLSRSTCADEFVLASSLKALCGRLDSDDGEAANRILGTFVCKNSPRMLSTVWTILMQKLRFAESIKGKVMILHHFSTVCGRILVPQRRRAFDVFATEISPLLSNSNLVCDKAFQTSYNRILRDLGPLAEEETVTTLYGIIKEKLKSATAGPVLRSLVGLLTKLVSTRRSNFLREVMALSGELEPKIFVLVLDSICAEMVGKSSGESTSVDTDPVESSIIGLLSAASRDATSANIIPSLVSCFSKVKQISIFPKYIDEETVLCSSFIEALSQPTTKKILCVPYLNFLASTTVDWWEARDSVWILLNSTDPLTRSAALQAMSHAIKESRADIAVEDMTREVERLLEYFVKFSEEGCTYSLSASLNFFEAVIEKSQSADELLDYLSVFFEVLQKNKTAIANGAVCSALLSLVGKSRQLHKMFYEFVYDNVGSGNAIIRQASLKLLVQWCSHYALPNELSAVELGMFPQECEIQMPSVFLQNTVSILNYLMEEFSRYSLADDKTDFKTICTIYEFLLCANDAYTFTDPQNCAFYALPNLLLEILNYTIEMPVDVFITLLKSISAASSMTGGLTCDGQTMLSGFNIVWNLLHRCASVTDAAGTLELHCEECLLFSHVEMGDHFDATVAAIGEIAFSNKEAFEETEFYAFTSALLAASVTFIEGVKGAPIFLSQLCEFSAFVANCAFVLVDFNPAGCFELLTATFECHRVNTDILAADRTASFLKNCSPAIAKVLHCNFQRMGKSLFKFLMAVVEFDGKNSTAHYLVLDDAMQIVQRVISVLGEEIYCTALSAEDIGEMLAFLQCLSTSVHANQFQQHVTTEEIENCKLCVENAVHQPQLELYFRNILESRGTDSWEDRILGRLTKIEASSVDATEALLLFEEIQGFYAACHQTSREHFVEKLVKLDSVTSIVFASGLSDRFLFLAAKKVLGRRSSDYILEMLIVLLLDSNPTMESFGDMELCRENNPHLMSELIKLCEVLSGDDTLASEITFSPQEDPEEDIEFFAALQSCDILKSLSDDPEEACNILKNLQQNGEISAMSHEFLCLLGERCLSDGIKLNIMDEDSFMGQLEYLIQSAEENFHEREKVLYFAAVVVISASRGSNLGEQHLLKFFNLCLGTKCEEGTTIFSHVVGAFDEWSSLLTYKSSIFALTALGFQRYSLDALRRCGEEASRDFELLGFVTYFFSTADVTDEGIEYALENFEKYLDVEYSDMVEPETYFLTLALFDTILWRISEMEKKLPTAPFQFPLARTKSAASQKVGAYVRSEYFLSETVTGICPPFFSVTASDGAKKLFSARYCQRLNQNMAKFEKFPHFVFSALLKSCNSLLSCRDLLSGESVQELARRVNNVCTRWLAKVQYFPVSSAQSLEQHMPSPNLGYVDSVHVAEVQDLLCSSNGILLQYPNVKQTSITVARRLLSTDVFCRVVALQSAEKLLRLVAQEEGKGLMDDVLSCLQAQLSVSGKAQFVFPFVVEQTCIFLSRALAKYSDENVTAKCIELLWSTLLSDPKQRTLSVLHFSHLLLDCVVSVTDPETPRFELLGKLLDPVKGENYTDASMRDDITKLATHRGVAGGLSNAYTPLSFRMEISESSNFVMNLLTDSRNILLLSPTAFYLSKLSEMEEKNGVDRAATSLVCVHDSMATFRESDPYTPVVARQEQRILETLLEYMEKWELLFFGVLNHFDFSYHDKMSFLRLLRAKASGNKDEYFQWVTMGGKCLISLCRAEEDVWWILSALVVLHSGASEENIILTCLHKSVEKQKIVFKRLLESNCADRDALILFLEDIMRDDNPSEVITSVWKEAQLLLPGQ